MNIYNLINDNSAPVKGPDGKDNIPSNNEPVTVKGTPGKDKVAAVVPEGTFVVPKSNAPVAVKLSKDELLIPPSQVPAMDAKAKAAGMSGISALAPNAKPSVPSYTEAKDWNDYLLYFNDKVKKDGITDEELDKGDGSYAQKSFEEYATQKKLPYKYDEYTKKIQQYWNDVYNSQDPLALMNVRGRYTKEELSKVDGRIGSLTRNYYAPTVNHGSKYDTGEVIGGYRGVPDPYNGGISIFDTNNMSADEAKKQYLELAAKKINEANKQKVVQGYHKGGFVHHHGANGEVISDIVNQQATDALGVSYQDIAEMDNQQAQTDLVNPVQQMQEPNTDQMLANAPVIPENDGSQAIIENSKKIQEMLGITTPKFDDKKAERLKKIAAVNSIGQALSTAFGGYIGTKGGPILNTATPITPAALAEYNAMLEKDKDNKYRTNILQVQEAVRGMHDVAANELLNKRANQKLIADTQQYINKFKLDKYADNEKYRRDIDAKLFQYGIDVKKIAQKQGYDEGKTKSAVENAWKLARYNQSQQNYRAKLSSDGKDKSEEVPVTFNINGVQDELYENDVIALANAALTDKVQKAGNYVEELKDDPDYQYIFRASSGGLNAKELKQFVQKYYPIYGDKAGVVSRNDAGKTRQPQYITPQGKVMNVGETEPQVEEEVNQSANNANPFGKYGGTVVK